jgi:hypothetical protein
VVFSAECSYSISGCSLFIRYNTNRDSHLAEKKLS